MKLLRGIYQFWNRERMGLIMIFGSLAVIIAVIQLVHLYQHKLTENDLRTQGLSMAKLVAEIPYDQLHAPRARNTLSIIYQSQSSSRLAYVALVDAQGQPVQHIAAPGVNLPIISTHQEPSHWIGERHVQLSSDKMVLEFFAPWLVDSKLKGFIRLGYFETSPIFGLKELPFIGTIALLVFLLTPLFYALVMREIRPLKLAQNKIASQIGIPGKSSNSTSDLVEFIDGVGQYVHKAEDKIVSLENERSTLITSSRVAAYKYNKFEAMLQALPDGMLVLDETGAVTFANNKIATMFDTTTQRVLDGPIDNWCPDRALGDYVANAATALSGADSAVKFNLGEAENLKIISASVYPIYASEQDSDKVGSLLLLRDYTQQSHADNYREEFVAHICHELKTPLNALSLYSESLLESDADDEAFKLEAINVIYDETHRMKDLINNLLNITKIEMGNMSISRQRVKLQELLRDIFDNITKGVGDTKMKFNVDIPSGVEDLALDKTLFRIAISNLLTNAIKYNRDDGEVTLRLEELEHSVKISVKDTGIGISDDDKDQIFEKFYRSDNEDVRQKSGHGLGLALARDIILLHNGYLTLNSELGKGTEFIVEIYKETDLLRKAG